LVQHIHHHCCVDEWLHAKQNVMDHHSLVFLLMSEGFRRCQVIIAVCIHGFALAISSSDSLVARSFKSFKTYFKVSPFKFKFKAAHMWQDIYPNLKFYTKRIESLKVIINARKDPRYYKALASQNFSISTGFYASRSLLLLSLLFK